ncbi:hypothetical protein DSECCO2_203320 [anaerobic digester metagenome]
MKRVQTFRELFSYFLISLLPSNINLNAIIMEPKNLDLLKSTMTNGLYLGLALVIYSLLLFLFNIMPIGIGKSLLLFVVTMVIYIGGIIWAIKRVRAEVFGGEVSYWQAVLIGVLVAFFAAIISGVYSYLQNTIIDPDYVSRFVEAQKEWMYDFMSSKNVPESDIEDAINRIDASSVGVASIKTIFSSIIGGTIGGFVISLIVAASLKKKEVIFTITETKEE